MLIGIIFAIFISCEKESNTIEEMYVAEIVGYDLNCSTCILYFPNDTAKIKDVLGNSRSNFYQTVNLNQSDFEIGQLIKVKVRQAEDYELRACTTLYPTNDFENICITDFEKYQDSNFIYTIELNLGDCITTFGQATLCLDTVLNDSRCPVETVCVWEGNAEVKIDLSIIGNGNHSIELNTNHSFSTDTSLNHLNISLIELTPYPKISEAINPKDYKVKLSVTNLNMVESNAQILGFNPEKCACCQEWTIKTGNDTIKSDNVIIGETVGYEIKEPVDVYIELGEKEMTCSEMIGVDYYDIKKIIKKVK